MGAARAGFLQRNGPDHRRGDGRQRGRPADRRGDGVAQRGPGVARAARGDRREADREEDVARDQPGGVAQHRGSRERRRAADGGDRP
jgi:hypothetical protein